MQKRHFLFPALLALVFAAPLQAEETDKDKKDETKTEQPVPKPAETEVQYPIN